MFLLLIGGAAGTCLRYMIARWFDSQPGGQAFPIGTFFINVTGSFILGTAALIILERLPPEHQHWYLLVGTGFCGAYTTFSTFEWESFRCRKRPCRLRWLALGSDAGQPGASSKVA
jgi:fluoride exporter